MPVNRNVLGCPPVCLPSSRLLSFVQSLSLLPVRESWPEAKVPHRGKETLNRRVQVKHKLTVNPGDSRVQLIQDAISRLRILKLEETSDTVKSNLTSI